MDFNESKTVKVFKILAAISVAAVTVLGFAASPASAIRDDVVESDVVCQATDEDGNTEHIVIGSIVYAEQECSGFAYYKEDSSDLLPFERLYSCSSASAGAGPPNSSLCQTIVYNGGGVYTRFDVSDADGADCMMYAAGVYAILGDSCAW